MHCLREGAGNATPPHAVMQHGIHKPSKHLCAAARVPHCRACTQQHWQMCCLNFVTCASVGISHHHPASGLLLHVPLSICPPLKAVVQ